MKEYTTGKSKRRKKHRAIRIISGIFTIFTSTVLFLVIFLLGVLLILMKGPSKDAARLFTLSANETSAMKWLPKLFLSEATYEEYLTPVGATVSEVDAEAGENVIEDDFVPLPIANINGEGPATEVVVGEIDESLPELEVIDIIGGTFKGKMMLVRNPARVKIASIDSFGGVGKTLSEFVEMYDAIGCTNAGGFEDENGKGKGGIPDGIVIKNGQITYGSAGTSYRAVVGFDKNNILHVGNMTGQECINIGIDNATNFAPGPILIKDGVRQTGFVSGINPRTAIGQAADGTVILLALEGRMADSLGATFDDLADLMEKYGAVNACNLDGGSSSGMYYEGERITRSASVIGDRPLPTAVIVTR